MLVPLLPASQRHLQSSLESLGVRSTQRCHDTANVLLHNDVMVDLPTDPFYIIIYLVVLWAVRQGCKAEWI